MIIHYSFTLTLKGTLIKWNSVSSKGLIFQEPWKPWMASRSSMDGLVRFLKDQAFDAVSSIILMDQGALKRNPRHTAFRKEE